MRRLAILIVLALAVAPPAFAQRVALVIGNSGYRHVERLANPGNDARAIATALRPLGFQVELLVDGDRAAMEGAIRRFGSRAEGAEAALFFYAGHAIEVGGQNMLAPVSAQVRNERDLPFELIGLDLLMSQAEGRARVLLVFLDACRDNPFRNALAASGRGGATRGLAPPQQTATGTLIAFATSPGNVALDGRGANSPFTAALLRHVATPGLEVRSLMGRVRQSVRVETQGRQLPWDSSSLEGEFFFRSGTASAGAASAPAIAAVPPPSVQAPQAAAVPPTPSPVPPPAPSQQLAARTSATGSTMRPGCPAPGFRSTSRNGFPFSWMGADPGNASVCVLTEPQGTQRRLLLGIWSAGDPDSAGFAQALQAMFPPSTGKEVSIRRQISAVRVDETWSWVSPAEAGLAAPGSELVLQRRIRIRADPQYEALRFYALDPATGAITAVGFRHMYGQSYMGSWPSSISLNDEIIDRAVER